MFCLFFFLFFSFLFFFFFFCFFFFFKQKTAYEILRSEWSSDVCSSDLWGLAATDESLRPLNARLHGEGAAIFAEAIRTAWPETRSWSRDRFEHLRVAIATFVFGLSAAGVTSPAVWTPYVQREQLRAFLEMSRS